MGMMCNVDGAYDVASFEICEGVGKAGTPRIFFLFFYRGLHECIKKIAKKIIKNFNIYT